MKTSTISHGSSVRRMAIRAVAAAATAMTLLAGTAGGASASTLHGRQYQFKVAEHHVDFGSGGHTFGFPNSDGTMEFNAVEEGGVITAYTGWLHGRVYFDDPFATGCVRMRVRYYSSTGAWLKTKDSANVCHKSWGLVTSKAVDLEYSNVHIAYVKVHAQYTSDKTGAHGWDDEGDTKRFDK